MALSCVVMIGESVCSAVHTKLDGCQDPAVADGINLETRSVTVATFSRLTVLTMPRQLHTIGGGARSWAVAEKAFDPLSWRVT